MGQILADLVPGLVEGGELELVGLTGTTGFRRGGLALKLLGAGPYLLRLSPRKSLFISMSMEKSIWKESSVVE